MSTATRQPALQPGSASVRSFVTSLFEELSGTQAAFATSDTQSNQSGSDDAKHILLHIHALFPNELLPALDILDRGLITRLRASGARQQASQLGDAQGSDQQAVLTCQETSIIISNPYYSDVYYVRSSREQQQRREKWRDATEEMATQYEIRLVPWSCSCPAFTFAAFPAAPPPRSGNSKSNWRLGGVSLGEDLPMCKHILACALASSCPMFSNSIVDRVVSVDELAGWAAAYGD